jgi:ABC-type multidrug transport system fused ATPase/permease subunit
MIKKILALLDKNCKNNLLSIILNSVLLAAIELLVFYLLQIIITYLVDKKDAIQINYKISNFFSHSLTFENVIIIFFFIFFIRGLFSVSVSYQRNLLAKNVNDNLSKNIFENFINRDYEFFINNKSSSLISNIINEVDKFSSLFLDSLIFLITESFLIIVIISFLLFSYFTQTILFSFIIICFFWIFFSYYKKRFIELGKKKFIYDANRLEDLQKSFYVIQNIKIDNLESYYSSRFLVNTKLASNCNFLFKFISDIPRPAAELVVSTIVFILLYIFYFHYGMSKTEVLSMLGIFMVAMFRVIPSINKIGLAINNLRFYGSAADILYNIIFVDINNNKLSVNNGFNSDFTFNKFIVLKNVNFNYQLSNESQLKNINLNIKKYNSVSIRGLSGSGKTTLLNLICGLLNPTSGEILVDNQSLNLFKRKYQKTIGYVSQKTYLSDESIIKNVIFGKDEKDYDYKLFEEAIKKANLSTLINQLKNGKDAIIGEMGSRLSGGQQQRIGIARALYKKPQILILDEPTTALDENSEDEIIQTIKNLKNYITIIIVSHNKKLLEICDQNYLIEDGQLFLKNI